MEEDLVLAMVGVRPIRHVSSSPSNRPANKSRPTSPSTPQRRLSANVQRTSKKSKMSLHPPTDVPRSKSCTLSQICDDCGISDPERSKHLCPNGNDETNNCGSAVQLNESRPNSLPRPSPVVHDRRIPILKIEATVDPDHHRPPYRLKVDIKVGSTNACLLMVVSSGSTGTVLPRYLCEHHFPNAKYDSSTMTAASYGGRDLQVIGVLQAVVTYKERSKRAAILVADTDPGEQPLLGLDLFEELNIRVFDSDGEVVRRITMEMVREGFPGLFTETVRHLEGYHHQIDIKPGASPVAHKLRRPAMALKDKAADGIRKMEKQGVIERIDSSAWVNPMVVVLKQSGDVNVRADLRDMNKQLVSDRFPNKTVDEMLAAIGDSRVFSVLPIRKDLIRIRLTPQSRQYTAFLTPIGLFQNVDIPAGYVAAKCAFNKALDTILSGIPNTIAYIDSILVHSKTDAEHERIVRQTLLRLENAQIALDPRKVVVHKPVAKFHGYILSATGVRATDNSVQAVLQMPKPVTPKDIECFLHMCTEKAEFIHGLPEKTEPFHKAVSNIGPGKYIAWNARMERSFQELKLHLSRSPVVGHYQIGVPTVVTTAASSVGLGAALSQMQDNRNVVIACASRVLTDSQSKWSVTERKGFAVIWACERWADYLWGVPFTIRTDHNALVPLFNSSLGAKVVKPFRIARWYLRLSEFDYTLEHDLGANSSTADALSRMPLPEKGGNKEPDTDAVKDQSVDLSDKAISWQILSAESAADPFVTSVRAAIDHGWSQAYATNPDLEDVYHIRSELAITDKVVLRGSHICVLPAALRRHAMSLAHEGHPGISKTKERLMAEYWWPTISQDIDQYLSNCSACQSSDRVNSSTCTRLPLPSTPTKPWSKLALDITGPYSAAPYTQQFLMILQDYTSKWPEVACCGYVASSEIIDFLNGVFSRLGYPESIATVNDEPFRSQELSLFLRGANVLHVSTPSGVSIPNGIANHLNNILNESVPSDALEGKPWHRFIQDIVQAYRSSPLPEVGMTPFELLHGGRKMRTKASAPMCIQSHKAQNEARQPAARPQKQHKDHTFTRTPMAPSKLQTGDLVRYKLPTSTASRARSHWSTALRVVMQRGPAAYELENGKVCHARNLTRLSMPQARSAQDIASLDKSNAETVPEQNNQTITVSEVPSMSQSMVSEPLEATSEPIKQPHATCVEEDPAAPEGGSVEQAVADTPPAHDLPSADEPKCEATSVDEIDADSLEAESNAPSLSETVPESESGSTRPKVESVASTEGSHASLSESL